jgi:hypothetical protein
MQNWYGNYEDGWRNKETGEELVFKERDEEYQVWIYKTTARKRGQLLDRAESKVMIIVKGKERAKKYEEEGWAERLEIDGE